MVKNVDFIVVNLNGEIKWTMLPCGKFIVDCNHVKEFIKKKGDQL